MLLQVERKDMLAVRPARAEDLPGLMALGRLAHAETRYRSIPLDEDKLLTAAGRYLSQGNRYCLLVAERDRRVIGLVAGLIDEYFFSRRRFARDLVFYVAPDARGGPAALRLIAAFSAWAAGNGVDEVQIGISSGRKIGKADQLLQRQGFEPVGGLYRRRLP